MDKGNYVYKKITLRGIVQGVGIRPFICCTANECGIAGSVKNCGSHVEILAGSSEDNFITFLDKIKTTNIPNAQIEDICTVDIAAFNQSDFIIAKSSNTADCHHTMISADLSVCDACLQEMSDPANRRYNHHLISCTVCGPRFSIIHRLPYDRDNTSMLDFEMCADCKREYSTPNNRRFHAQTNSCRNCGPQLIYKGYRMDEAFNCAIDDLRNEKIIGIKGIGGYHFTCLPYSSKAIDGMRALKNRLHKPFAVMFSSIEDIGKYCYVSDEEEQLLKSSTRPIVLLEFRHNPFAKQLCYDSALCGCFLPYTPLQAMLTHTLGPLVMTSANTEGAPIITSDEDMLALKNKHLHGVLYHKRRIVRPLDDSVVKIADGKPQILRRARGYAPIPHKLDNPQNTELLALGGDLKSSFCIVKNNHGYLSGYLGDLENAAANDAYNQSVDDLTNLLNAKPDYVVCDMHPAYFSSGIVKKLSLPVTTIQHHHAHVASVIAEHEIQGQVIGIAFDGIGYGTDGNIWGGEFFVYNDGRFKRSAHLAYTPLMGGDSSSADAKKTAACYLIENNLTEYINDNRLDLIKKALEANVNTVLSSSMGRLFDAVCSILSVHHENRYEGECAIKLEECAAIAKRNGVTPVQMGFAIAKKNDNIIINSNELLRAICHGVRNKEDTGAMALGFHAAISNMVTEVCSLISKGENISTVALSGGVFQNTLLTNMTCMQLREYGFRVYINRTVPPNDQGICLGQAYLNTKTERIES